MIDRVHNVSFFIRLLEDGIHVQMYLGFNVVPLFDVLIKENDAFGFEPPDVFFRALRIVYGATPVLYLGDCVSSHHLVGGVLFFNRKNRP